MIFIWYYVLDFVSSYSINWEPLLGIKISQQTNFVVFNLILI